jgi:ABC-type Fe3+-siderophore transport system permease subunit
MNDKKQLSVRVWRWPLMICAASITGLVSALVGDGWADMLAWIGLGAPVLIAGFFMLRKS